MAQDVDFYDMKSSILSSLQLIGISRDHGHIWGEVSEFKLLKIHTVLLKKTKIAYKYP